MAVVETGPNLQKFGDNGQYQTDRSTWGFANPANTYIVRILEDGGNYVAGISFDLDEDSDDLFNILPSRFPLELGNKYRARLQIRRDPDTPLSGSEILSIGLTGSHENITIIDEQSIELGELTDEYTTIYLDFEANFTKLNYSSLGLILDKQIGGVLGLIALRVDSFEVYKIETDDPLCTLEITQDTIVTPDTSGGAGNGIIEVDIIGAVGEIEYSLSGDVWQDSNTFTGLITGPYTVYAREKDLISCIASQTFYVNVGDPVLQVSIQVVNETVLGAADGRIIVTASEGLVPYQYSIDGGENYQLSNQFSNLLPGTYTVVVKDDNNEIVAQNVTILAGTYSFTTLRYSKNPIIFEQPQGANSEEDNYRITCEVQIDNDGNFVEALTTERPPDLEGKAKFNVRLAFDGYINPSPPDQEGSLITKITDRSIRARNRFGELWDTMIDPQIYLTTQPYLVLLGGIEKRHFAETDFFNSWLVTNKKFLSWMPGPRTADRSQEDYISFLIYNKNMSTIKYNVKLWYDDDTTAEDQLDIKNGVAFGEIYEFRIGPANSGVLLLDPTKNLLRYDVWITNQDDIAVSEVLTVRISELRKRHTRYYLFLNSLGGYEVLRTTGLTKSEAEITNEIINVFLPTDYQADQGEEITHNPRNQRFRDVSSGYQLDKYWIEWYQDFRLSPRVYDITNGNRNRVNIEDGSMPLFEDQDYRHYMRFRAREAYTNEVFTPNSI